MSFGPISALSLSSNSSKYKSIHPKGTSCGRLRIETQSCLDLEPKSYFLDTFYSMVRSGCLTQNATCLLSRRCAEQGPRWCGLVDLGNQHCGGFLLGVKDDELAIVHWIENY